MNFQKNGKIFSKLLKGCNTLEKHFTSILKQNSGNFIRQSTVNLPLIRNASSSVVSYMERTLKGKRSWDWKIIKELIDRFCIGIFEIDVIIPSTIYGQLSFQHYFAEKLCIIYITYLNERHYYTIISNSCLTVNFSEKKLDNISILLVFVVS